MTVVYDQNVITMDTPSMEQACQTFFDVSTEYWFIICSCAKH